MAIDDVISDYDNDVLTTAQLTIQPASGDEWLVTHLLVEAASWSLRPHTNTADFQTGLHGGDTTVGTNLDDPGMHPVKLFLTNGEYIKLQNGAGGTQNGGFSAIKTKD